MVIDKRHLDVGLIGNPLSHSRSPVLFDILFKQYGIDGSYRLLEMSALNDLPDYLRIDSSLAGFNVTIPYKQDIIKYLDAIDANALKIGAVNTVRITRNKNGKNGDYYLTGYNTDYLGIIDTLRSFNLEKIGNAIIFGTGGAAKACGYALHGLSVNYCMVSRSFRGSRSYSTESGLKYHVIRYEDLTYYKRTENTLFINATPIGLWPDVNKSLHLPDSLILPNDICFDLIYNPTVTSFMKQGADKGATVKNGLQMLESQAVAALRIWLEQE